MARMFRLLPFAWLAPLLTAGCNPADTTGPVIVIEAAYPGASAQTVTDAVATPIEQQVNGVENSRFIRSRCSSDGRCKLTIAFAPGTDAAMAQVLVQNRVALAMPILPRAVQGGIAVLKKPQTVAFLVGLSSPEGRFDAVYLSGYAAVNLKDEVARLAGVGSVMLVPELPYTMRLVLDPAKLGKLELTAADVAKALTAQNLDARRLPGGDNKAVQIEVTSPGRRELTPAQLEEVIVKVVADQVIRLKDLGHAEVTASRDHAARLNGKDVAILAVATHTTVGVRDVQNALVRKIAELEKALPDGLRLELLFDFAPNLENPGQRSQPEYLVLDVDLPAADVALRAEPVLREIARTVESVEGVKNVLTMTDNPLDEKRGQPCVLVRLLPERERKMSRAQLAESIRAKLDGMLAGATVRVRFPLVAGAAAGWSYPIQLAVHGADAESVRKLATRLANRLRTEAKMTDVWLDPATAPRPQIHLDVNREQAAKLGVQIADVHDLLRLQLTDAPPAKQVDEIMRLKIRNDQGAMVALSALVTARVIEAPAVVNRLDGKPMAAITANPPPDTPISAARSLCERLVRAAREELQLPAAYDLTWLRILPAR
jgi:multidrug efflux pump subunit AcrB